MSEEENKQDRETLNDQEDNKPKGGKPNRASGGGNKKSANKDGPRKTKGGREVRKMPSGATAIV